MTCSEFRIRLSEWILSAMEGEQADVQPPAELNDHAQRCDSCNRRLAAALVAVQGYPTRPEPLKDLPDRIKARISTSVHERKQSRFKRARLIRCAAAAAVLIIAVKAGIMIGRGVPTAKDGQQAVAQQEVLRVEFRLHAPDAATVAVVGDWNSWDPATHPLSDQDGDGIWETTITLRRGMEYQYQFLIDDETWVPDPASPLTVDDGFGGTDSVLNI